MATEPTIRTAVVKRPYYYATSMENTVFAYTAAVWGIGGSQPSGNYSVHTTTGLYVVTILMTVPAIFSPVLLVIAVASLNIIVGLLALVCTVLFTGGWLLGISNIRRERQASRQRKLKGLPKPRFALTDDQARDWFESRPSGIPITRENFPDSKHPFPGESM
jgi:hypothetical protein